MIIKRNRGHGRSLGTADPFGQQYTSQLGSTRGPCLPGEWDDPTWIDVQVDDDYMDQADAMVMKRASDIAAYHQRIRAAKDVGA